MLLQLNIKDFAIIDNLQVSFGKGLNILTGETGAGKSIIVDAVKLILGDRASAEDIRSSKDEAVVEAMFDISPCKDIANILDESGLRSEEGLIIRRIISRSGKNKVFINESMANLALLQQTGSRIIDIYGQHDHQSLTRPEEHIDILDSFGGLAAMKQEFSNVYKEYISIKSELDKLASESRQLAEKQDFLSFQSKEIEAAGLKTGEDEELKKGKEILVHAEKLFDASSSGHEVLYSSGGSVLEKIGHVVNKLKDVSRFDERLKPMVEALESASCQIEDAASFLRDYSGGNRFEPGRLEEVDNRLDAINKLRKKYGQTIEAILQKKAEIDKELDGIIHHDERMEELKKALDVSRDKAISLAKKLSDKRAGAGRMLKKKIEQELADLGMKKTVFEVKIKKDADEAGNFQLSENGIDKIEFFISPNPGEEPKPLAKIASGGELSRIMLAIKRTMTRTGKIPVLIFDEVDAGIGGGTAEVVGKKLKEVSKNHQVLCITHLPQIAAYADAHYSVEKEVRGGRTCAKIKELKGEEKVAELSRMLGGVKITEKTKEHAVEMLENAKIQAIGDRR
ncbi:MAG: DNA repair protein RecN [Deltaproteobacteria bacterium]|nr:DNA repair protein RecN [Deltaproteobacteria bacterium]